MAEATTRVEGRIALKMHGVQNADVAASILSLAFDGIINHADQTGLFEDLDIEVVAVDLVQVQDAVSDTE